MNKLSTGKDSTLGNWLELVEVFFSKDGKAAQFLRDKIAESPNGNNEEVLSDERQLLQILGQIEFGAILKADLPEAGGAFSIELPAPVRHVDIRGYTPADNEPEYFQCPDCQRKSYNLNDIKHSYCGACNKFF